MENDLNELLRAYLEKYPKDAGEIFTLQMQVGDDELLEILRQAHGRRIVLKDSEHNDLDDGPISWRYD